MPRRWRLGSHPDLPGNPLVWHVLLETRTLKDGMSLAEAKKLLGPPTGETDERVEWYFNPVTRHGTWQVARCLSARVKKEGLKGWKFGYR